jgi:hypothetical protein
MDEDLWIRLAGPIEPPVPIGEGSTRIVGWWFIDSPQKAPWHRRLLRQLISHLPYKRRHDGYKRVETGGR